MEVTTSAIDQTKNVFALCGADAKKRVVLRKELRRAQSAARSTFFQRRIASSSLQSCDNSKWNVRIELRQVIGPRIGVAFALRRGLSSSMQKSLGLVGGDSGCGGRI